MMMMEIEYGHVVRWFDEEGTERRGIVDGIYLDENTGRQCLLKLTSYNVNGRGRQKYEVAYLDAVRESALMDYSTQQLEVELNRRNNGTIQS